MNNSPEFTPPRPESIENIDHTLLKAAALLGCGALLAISLYGTPTLDAVPSTKVESSTPSSSSDPSLETATDFSEMPTCTQEFTDMATASPIDTSFWQHQSSILERPANEWYGLSDA